MIVSAPEAKEDEDTEEDEEKKPKTKTIKETTSEWELLNDVKAVWLRSPKEVTDEEYSKFYHSLAKVKRLVMDLLHKNEILKVVLYVHLVLLEKCCVICQLHCRTLVMRSLCPGATSLLKEMLSSKLCSLFPRRLHMISTRVTTTTTSQTSSCMLEEFLSLMNLMTFFRSISTF